MIFSNEPPGLYGKTARLPEIVAGLTALKPDSYITEVAEERVELGTMGAGITPTAEQYANAARFLIAESETRHAGGFARVTQGFRPRYYALAARILAERTLPPAVPRDLPPLRPAAPAASSATPSAELEATLRRLGSLRRDGLLTEEEFQVLRRQAVEKAKSPR